MSWVKSKAFEWQFDPDCQYKLGYLKIILYVDKVQIKVEYFDTNYLQQLKNLFLLVLTYLN